MSDKKDSIEAILARMQLRPMTPDEEAERTAATARDDHHRRQQTAEELRRGWNAPKRHAQVVALERGGAWGDVEKRLSVKLGSGFLIALLGGRGSGKTQIAVELMRLVTRAQRPALYATTAEFFMAIKATYRKDSDEGERDVLMRYRRPSLLVLDEFGRRAETDWENNLLFELLDKRYANLTDTLLLSNQTRAELIEALGPSLSSRMQETGGLIECNWPSWRNAS